MSPELRTIIGLSAVALTFIGYIPYFRDIVKGTTKPHMYTWFLWSLLTGIAFGLQISDNAGPGAWVTLAAATMCTTVFIMSLFAKGKKDITLVDTVFLVASLIALILWVFAKQPILSVILVTTTDLLGFGPTIRKTWNKPYSETLSFYALNTFRFGLAVIALSNYGIVSALYPVSWMFGNGLFALMLLIRRNQIKANT